MYITCLGFRQYGTAATPRAEALRNDNIVSADCVRGEPNNTYYISIQTVVAIGDEGGSSLCLAGARQYM